MADPQKALKDILTFYVEAGVDAVLGDEPVNRFADRAAPEPAPPAAPVSSSAERSFTRRDVAPGAAMPAPPPPEEAVMAARAAAKSAATLEELRTILDGFQGCGLRLTAKQLVFADGNPQTRLMFVGEAPGRDEDLQGLPFIGVSGQLLNRMLAAIGYDRQQVYIANIVPWRPPGNRTPTPQEAAICLPFIQRQIELTDPDVLVCLGGPSAQILLGIKDGIRKARGRWMTYHTGTRDIRAMATFHPAYLLRQPLEKRFAWRDFLAVKKALSG